MKHFSLVGSAAVVGIRNEIMFSKLWEDVDYGAQIVFREALEPAQAWLEMPIIRPTIFELMGLVQGTRLGMVVAQRVKAGSEVAVPGGDVPWYQVIIQNLKDSTIKIGGEQVHPVGGEVWQWSGSEAILSNQSEDDAISLIVEIHTR